jgi:hypothetical protein
MVLLHGTGRQLQLRRIDKPLPKTVMTDFGQPTSERTLKRVRDSEGLHDTRAELLRGAVTMTATLVDPDYTAARQMVQALGLSVSSLVRKAYGDKIADRPGLCLPLGFMPIAYFVARSLSHESRVDSEFLAYPLANARHKIDNAHKCLLGMGSDEISPDHVDIELMSGTATIGGMTFSVPAVSNESWQTYRQEMDAIAMEVEDDKFDWFYDDHNGEEDDAMDIDAGF